MADMPATYNTQTNPDPSTHVIGVRFEKLGKLYHFDYTGFDAIQPQDYVIVDTARGMHMGQVMGFAERENSERAYKSVLRLANGRDLLLQQQWKQREVQIIIDCREMAQAMDIFRGVKFVAAEYNFDGTHLTILYSTEEDVEVNGLRQRLMEHVGVEVEFRRIGPREVARRMGGQGACGGPRCCSTFLTEFSPITIKMAKTQGIPLNPNEITGMCGRLRCCLIYEYEQYVEARKQLPKRNKLIGTPHGEARVADVHPLKDGVTVYIESQRHFVPREEITPLEEFRALQTKAAQGCSKNESGSCDCGARRPQSASGDLQAALDLAHSQPLGAPAYDEDDEDDGEDLRGLIKLNTPTDFVASDEDEAEESTSQDRGARPQGNRRDNSRNRRRDTRPRFQTNSDTPAASPSAETRPTQGTSSSEGRAPSKRRNRRGGKSNRGNKSNPPQGQA